VLTPADETQVCSAEVSATATSVRLAGLVNDTTYTVAVVSIDPGGGVSALSPQAEAMPQPTIGFYGKYKLSLGAATGCTLAPHSGRAGLPWMALLAALVLALGRSPRRRKNLAASLTRGRSERACPDLARPPRRRLVAITGVAASTNP